MRSPLDCRSVERHTGRRQFLKQLSGGAAAILAWPRSQEPLPVPPPVRGSTAGEQFWRLVREAFLIPRDRIYLNVGTLGPQPRTVVEAVEQHARRVAMTLPPGVAWDRLKERLGHFVNCDPAGLVFPRNTTEGMSFVAQGLELRAGDEVVTTDHEHVGGLSCWQLLAARRGVRLRQLSLPVPPASAAEVLERIEAALTRRTRVVSVSHLTFTTGLVLPVGEIVQLCRSKGIVSVIDGAHPPGLIPVDLERMDPDFYASSPHKWLLAPQGTGFLYIREDWRERLWPTIASEGWNDRRLGAQRFNHLGTMDESRLAGLEAALEFQETIGPELIQARIRELRQHLAQQLVGLPRLQVVSPADGDLVAGMVSFAVQGVTALELQRRLAELGNIRTRVIGEYDYGWMRLSPHIYNSPQELDRVISLLQQLV